MDKLYVVSVRINKDANGNKVFVPYSKEDHYFKDLTKAERYFSLKYNEVINEAHNKGLILDGSALADQPYVIFRIRGEKNFTKVTITFSERLFED